MSLLHADSTRTFLPKVWVQDPLNQQQLNVCRRCCKGLGTASSQLLKCNGLTVTIANDPNPGNILPELIDVIDPPVACTNECGAVYCSLMCRQSDWDHTHKALCVGPLSEDDPLVALMRLALESDFYTELMLAARLAVCATEKDFRKWLVLSEGDRSVVNEVFEQAWLFVKETSLLLQRYRTSEVWVGLCMYVVAQRLELEVVSFPHVYITALYYATGDVQESAQKILLGLLPDDMEFDEELTSAQRFRKVIADPESYFPSIYVSAVFEEFDTIPHSCAPNLRVEVAKDSATKGLNVRVSKVNDSSWSLDLPPSIARVEVDGGVEERQELLREVLGYTGTCSCIRCTHDCNEGGDINAFKLLANDAMENERYDDAMRFLTAALRLDPTDGKALHERARVTSWSDQWSAAHQLLLQAYTIAPENSQISAEMDSYRAYTSPFAGIACPTTDIPRCDRELYDGKVRVYERLLDAGKCSAVIAQVEAQVSADGGWTTSRHYAVPTTDIPVHTVPAALAWFNESMHSHVFPLLAGQFDVVAEQIRVIDAFVVKYTSDKQRALPLHCDQSQFSLTIAMNSREDYEGGGTFFEETGDVVNCDKGGVISFDGALLHGGYPVSSATRYVVVAFLYEEVEDAHDDQG